VSCEWLGYDGAKGDKVIANRSPVIRMLVGYGLLATNYVALSQEPGAEDIVMRFCQLDAQGEQLTPNGWHKMETLFATPVVPRPDKIMVIKDFVVSHGFPEKDKVGFVVDYTPVGSIDLSEGIFSPLPPTLQVRVDLFVNQVRPESRGTSGQAAEHAEWRIQGPPPEPHLRVHATIQYLSRERANAKDAHFRKNADQTLATLKRLR
jgi:hypothetical protein